MNEKTISLRISEELYEKLREFAYQKRKSVSQIIRELLEIIITREKKPEPQNTGDVMQRIEKLENDKQWFMKTMDEEFKMLRTKLYELSNKEKGEKNE